MTGMMSQPGLPQVFAVIVASFMLAVVVWSLSAPVRGRTVIRRLSLGALPSLRPLIRVATRTPWVLLPARIVMVALFALAIVAGFFGTPIPARNFATVVTWTFWWGGVVLAALLLGSVWCAICPWQTVSGWFVHKRLWRRASSEAGLNLRLPRWARNTWPASILLLVLIWLEFGFGMSSSPFATAVVGLGFVGMATLGLAVFERRAWCRYFCPAGRMIAAYAQLAPVELRPVDTGICAGCRTHECYHGTDDVDLCPAHLVVGQLRESTFCTSCGNCARACPSENVAWQLRLPASDALHEARPRWDHAWFMLVILMSAQYHGLTMIPLWGQASHALANVLGEAGAGLWGFSLSFVVTMSVLALPFTVTVWLGWRLGGRREEFRALFARFAFVLLPLALSYHVAHNLTHFSREGMDIFAVAANPVGTGAEPVSMAERSMRQMNQLLALDQIHLLQAAFLMLGFLGAVLILRNRGFGVGSGDSGQSWIGRNRTLLPVLVYVITMSAFHLWLVMQPMQMRM
ncbi:MAG: 4Fe-4S binding protein [Paracoccaceae bacterium]